MMLTLIKTCLLPDRAARQATLKKTLLITAVHRNKPEIKGILRLEVGQNKTFRDNLTGNTLFINETIFC